MVCRHRTPSRISCTHSILQRAVGVTCAIPIDLTLAHDHGRAWEPCTLFQQLHERNEAYCKLGRYHDTQLIQELTEAITQVNHEQRQRQIDTWNTFTLATHPGICHDSAVSRVLCSSPLYDTHVLQHIWHHVYVPGLPTCQADVDVLKHVTVM